MALVQARHLVASAGTDSLQNGHVLVGGSGSLGASRSSSDVMRYTTRATMTKEIKTLMNRPYRTATSVLGSPVDLRTTLSCEKSTLPSARPMGGMMTSLTSELTTLPMATPMITPTARASALVFSKNALKPDTESSSGRSASLDWATSRARAHVAA